MKRLCHRRKTGGKGEKGEIEETKEEEALTEEESSLLAELQRAD